jgi:hypothetical protein
MDVVNIRASIGTIGNLFPIDLCLVLYKRFNLRGAIFLLFFIMSNIVL